MESASDRPDLSVVVAFLNEQASLPLFRERFEKLGLPPAWELVFVDDGSTDRGPELVGQWAARDRRVKLLTLTRNFGQQAAICAGLDFAEGKFVGIMDADLQDPPEELLEMYSAAANEGWDIVHSVRASRRGSWLKRLAYWGFYSLYSFLAETPIAPDSGDFCVLSRRAADTLLSLPEKVRFVRGLRSWMGLRSKAVESARPERAAGEAQYSWSKLVSLGIHGITSFSATPLRIATFSGMLLCAIAMLLTVLYAFLWLAYDLHIKAPGFTTIVILLLFLSGVQFLMLGITGEYIAQIFWEVKRRPTYLVDRMVNVPEAKHERLHRPL